jgi:hypothetical protein
MLFDRPLVVKEGNVSVRLPNPLNFCIHKLIIAQRRSKPEKSAKDIEQAVHLFSILKPEEFRSEVEKLPKKWQALIRKSLAKAQQRIPSESANLKKFQLTPQ